MLVIILLIINYTVAEGEFVVEAVLDHRSSKTPMTSKTIEFLLKWEGYDTSYNSWEPFKNLVQNEIVHRYLILRGMTEFIPAKFKDDVEDVKEADQEAPCAVINSREFDSHIIKIFGSEASWKVGSNIDHNYSVKVSDANNKLYYLKVKNENSTKMPTF